MDVDRPLPSPITPEAKPFWDGCRALKLMLPRCEECGHVFFYPRILCPRCHSRKIGWMQASGRGTLHSFEIGHQSFNKALKIPTPYVLAMINVHEVWPGHYLQFLYGSRFPTKTRRLIFCGTNAEGWAHYTEQMMVDEGFGGGDPKVRLAQLQEALLRDCRYVVGIKLHTQGMTVEDGAKVFVEKGFQEPANAYEEARRGAYNPTYLYYTLGKLEIQKLRDDYRQAKGASLQQFHDAFVAQGALPIPLVRRILFR